MAALLGRVWRSFSARCETRRAIIHLEQMTDDELKDIGLCRSGIERAVRGLRHEQG